MVGFRHTLGSFDADLLKSIRLLHGPHDGFNELFYLFIQTTHVAVLLGGLLIDFHSLDSTIVLSGQSVEDEIGILVHTDQIAGLEGLVVDQAD